MTNAALLRWLFLEFGRRNVPSYLAAIALLGLSAAATSGIAWLLKPVLDHMVEPDGFGRLRLLCLAVAGLFVARGAAGFLATTLLARAGNSIVANVQRHVFDRLVHADLAFLDQKESSGFINRLGVAAAGTRDALQVLVLSFGRDALTLAGLVIVMFIHDAALALIVLTVMPIAAYWLGRLVRIVRVLSRRAFDESTRILGTVQETVQGIRIVKSFTLEREMSRRMADAASEVEGSANRAAARMALASPIADIAAGTAIAAVLYYGSWRVTIGSADPGSFFSFVVAFVLAYEPAKRLARVHLELQAGLVNARLIYELAEIPVESARPAGAADVSRALDVTRGKIVYSDVSFAYRPGEPVLDGLDLVFEPGLTNALTGVSGAGKSTIVALLLRFYEPVHGLISIDGQNIADADVRALRESIAFVSQDVFLFRGTLRENIGLGRIGASSAEIEDAARAAFAHDFIMRFRDGYETVVGELGATLSGGERQRIAIARAVLKNAPILVLDEPTSALDDESERTVRAALDALRRGRTTIVIAHRRETIIAADRTFLLEGGRVRAVEKPVVSQPG